MSVAQGKPAGDVGQVYRERREPLLRLAFLLTGSREAAEDVVQTVFAGAQVRWSTIDETWDEVCRLPQRQRAVVVLRFYEDLPLREIARLLGRPEGTVRSDLHRALDRLRRTLR